MPPVTLNRPDGTQLRVADEREAQSLEALGYSRETPGQEFDRHIEGAREDFYSRGGQIAKTAVEGLASGFTLGASDLLLGSEASQERARYNPGTRLGTEIVGSLATFGAGSTGTAARLLSYTPAGALVRGGKAVEAAVTARGVGQIGSAAARGVVEGAGFGAGSAITTAQLTGDPLTVEGVMAGVGWGAVFGGGLSALGAGAGAKLEARAEAKIAAKEAGKAAKNHTAASALDESHYVRFTTQIDDARTALSDATKVIRGDVEAAMPDFAALKRSQSAIYSGLADMGAIPLVRSEARAFPKNFALAMDAAKRGEYAKMNRHLGAFRENMIGIESVMGRESVDMTKVLGQADQISAFGQLRIDAATKAADEATSMVSASGALKMPRTVEGFVSLSPRQAEKLAAAVDQVGTLKSAELAQVQTAVKDAVSGMADSLGIKMDGPPGSQLLGVWKAMRSKAKEGEAAGLLGGGGSFIEQTAGRVVGAKLSNSLGGFGTAGGAAGYSIGRAVVGLLNMKGAVLGAVGDAITAWSPRAARGLQKGASRIEPLARRLDGTLDERKDRKELMRDRVREVSAAAPRVRDTLYKSVEGVAAQHPEFAAAAHALGVTQFQFLLTKMPKDPGLAYSSLKSLWRPDEVATEKWARYYEVFQDPVTVTRRALETGKMTLEHAEGLREMWPAIWLDFRVKMLDRISEPEIEAELARNYQAQVQLGVMLDLPLHATMDPRFIAAQQVMFTERNQPLEMQPRAGQGSGAGRPPGPGPRSTPSQRNDAH